MESPPTCPPPPGSPAACEPAGEWIGALEWSLNFDEWLHADLGGWNEIWYWGAALTFKSIMGEILDLPEVNGNFATDFITARISPHLFPSLPVHECARSGSHRGPTVPQSGSHLPSLVELFHVLSNEIQWEFLPVPSWLRNQLSGDQHGSLCAHGGWIGRLWRCLLLAESLLRWGFFWGLTSNSIVWSLSYVEKKNLAFTTSLNSCRVCALC